MYIMALSCFLTHFYFKGTLRPFEILTGTFPVDPPGRVMANQHTSKSGLIYLF